MKSLLLSYFRKRDWKQRRTFALFIIAVMVAPTAQLSAETARDASRNLFSFIDVSKPEISFQQIQDIQQVQDFQLQPSETPVERAARVASLRLCPRKLSLYAGESFTLVPLPLDRNAEPVQGVVTEWNTVNAEIASVTSYGEVTAVAAGQTVLTAQAGAARAKVTVEVRNGTRPVTRDMEWDVEHS